MDFLPEDIELIILDYKMDLEKNDEFINIIKPIKKLQKNYILDLDTEEIDYQIYVEDNYLGDPGHQQWCPEPEYITMGDTEVDGDNDGYLISEDEYIIMCRDYHIRKYIMEKLNNKEYKKKHKYICLNKNLEQITLKETNH